MDDARFYTFNNAHVLSGAKVIGFVGVGLSAFACTFALITLSMTNLLLGALSLLVYGAIIGAQRRHDPQLYIPFLIANGLTVIFNGVYVAFLLVMVIAMPTYWQYELEKEEFHHGGKSLISNARLTTGVILMLMSIVMGLSLWFESIVYRAYRYMKEEHTNLIPPDVFVK